MAFTLTPLYGQGGSYSAQFDRLGIQALASTAGVGKINAPSGGAMTGDLAVTTSGAANGLVNIAAGSAWVSGGTGQGFYYANNDASVTCGTGVGKTFNSTTASTTRIDLVYIKITDGGGTPSADVQVVTGTAATTPAVPVAPSIPGGTIGLPIAQVLLPLSFTSGASVVPAANITDVRVKAKVYDAAVATTSNVATPTIGNLVYDTSSTQLKAYNGSSWDAMLTSASLVNLNNTNMASAYRLVYSSNSVAGGGSAPPSPIAGQLWYQPDTNLMYVYNGASWNAVGNGATSNVFGTWTTFTVTCVQGTTPTQTTQYARFCRVGKLIMGNVYISFSAGTAGTAGTSITVTTSGLPVPVRQLNVGSYAFNKTSDGFYTGVLQLNTTPTFIFYQGPSGTYTSQLGSTPSVSIGNAASDHLEFNFTYEAAT
jgi:hypothetical protein